MQIPSICFCLVCARARVLMQGRSCAVDAVPVLRERARAAQRRVLRAAGGAGRAAGGGGLRGVGDGERVPRRARHLERGAGGGVEARRGRRARQGRRLLLPDMAHGPRLPDRQGDARSLD